VGDQSAIAREKYDGSWVDCMDFLPLNQKDITGPNRGKHAAAHGSQAQSSVTAKDFFREFAFRGVTGFGAIPLQLFHQSPADKSRAGLRGPNHPTAMTSSC
jgi:hypothetical protein